MKGNMILSRKGESSIVTYIKKRLKQNLNFIGLFSGATGIGKTWNGISLAWQLDPSFDPEKQIVFSLIENQRLINDEEFKSKKIKIIVFDEPQISISNRKWQSVANQMMNQLLSTFRHQNIVIIFCAPYKDFMDSQSMKLLHCVFECQGVNRKKKLSKVRPKLQQYNADKKKTYQHPVYVIRNGKVKPLRVWNVKKPPKELIDVYERRKTEFTSKLNKDIEEQLESLNKPKKEIDIGRKITNHNPLTEHQKKVIGYWKQGIFTQKAIGIKMCRSHVTIHEIEVALRNKGYYKADYLEKSTKSTN